MDATCSPPPEGASRWTLKLLGDHLVGLGLVDSLSNPTIGRALKNGLKQWQVEQWCLPPQGSAAFVCTMEDVLKTYNRPCDEKRPLVCFDEMCKQLFADVCEPQPALPGLAARVDYEYEQRGMCSAFMV